MHSRSSSPLATTGLLVLLVTASSAFALSEPDFATWKQVNYWQDTSSAPAVNHGSPDTPYQIDFEIGSFATSPTIKVGAGSASAIPVDDDSYYKVGGNFATSSALNTAFANSAAYLFSDNSGSASLTFGASDNYVTATRVTGGGTWSGGTLYALASSTLTLSGFNGSFSTGTNVTSVTIEDWSTHATVVETAIFGSDFTSLSLSGNGLSNGHTYLVSIGLYAVTGQSTGATGDLIGKIGYAGFTTQTEFFLTTSAVPEPSTYAAIFGGIALVGAAIWRRRRQG